MLGVLCFICLPYRVSQGITFVTLARDFTLLLFNIYLSDVSFDLAESASTLQINRMFQCSCIGQLIRLLIPLNVKVQGNPHELNVP